MSRIIQPVVSPRGRVIVLTGATLGLIAAMLLSATPEGASATPRVALSGSVLVETFEEIEGAPGLLVFPRLYTSAKGRVYVADRGGHRVIRLAEDGFRADVVYGREGAGPGELMYPRSVAADSNGNVFVTDQQLHRILKYAPDGTFLQSVTAPAVVSVVVDSEDRVIVRPGSGNALLQRYTNDLEEDVVLLEKTGSQHNSPLGVLIAIDADDRLFLLDQSDLTVKVYDRDMRLVDEWPVNPPQLEETIALRLAAASAKFPDRLVSIDGIQSMALDPTGGHLVFAYLVMTTPDTKETKIAWYTSDGTLVLVEDRGEERIYANAILPDGTILEGSPEYIRVRSKGTVTNADVENN